MTLDERNLQPYLVKILHLDDQRVNGTGFFCLPDGYVLTCYHVIAPHIEANKTGVVIIYQNETLDAQICKDYCNVDADIAVIKLVEQEKIWPYMELDVYNRWSLGDRVSSFGYPQDSSFRKAGIGITAKLVSATKDERTEVVQIVGGTLENVSPGFSGAPVLHQRTKKVIGLVNSKYELTQAFLVPLDTLYRQWPESRDFHDIFKKIRSKLANEARKKLNEKIKDTLFIPLRLECGKMPEQPNKKEGGELEEKEWTHGRKWEDFDLENLLPFPKSFVLSSSVGTGKTTFLYWLVTKIVEKTDIVPIFMTCAELESINPNTWDDLEKKLVSNYERNFSKEDLEDFFNTHFEKQKLFFLFDGLDQIGSNNYSGVPNRIFEICSPDSVLISSRPSAVISLESERNILFLRLKPFSLDEQRQYFAEHFEKAGRVYQLSPDLVHIPMLAYMVKILIKEGRAEGVSNRTGLYKRFIDYIIHKHEPHIPISSDDFQLTEDINEILKRLSFVALNSEEPQIQKIPMRLYIKENFKIDVAKLTTFGLVNRVVERGDFTGHYLFFMHQSFQEFLAAQYIYDNEELIKKVLDEMWAPKWKEVIKFLAGLRGQKIIEKILEKDNVIHAGLFLAAECVPEVKNIDNRNMEEIREKLRKLVDTEPFRIHSVHSLKYLKDITTLKSLLKDKNEYLVEEALRVLSDFEVNADDGTMIIHEIFNLLVAKKSVLQKAALEALVVFKDIVNKQDAHKIIDLLQESHSILTIKAERKALVALKDKLDKKCICRIFNLLQHKKSSVRSWAGETLALFKDKIYENDIRKIVELLGHEESDLRERAISILVTLKDRLDEQTITKIVSLSNDKSSYVRYEAIKALVSLKTELDQERARNIAIIIWNSGAMWDEDELVRSGATYFWAEFSDKLEERDICKIIDSLNDKNWMVRKAAIKAMAASKDQLREENVYKIVELLKDELWIVRKAAIKALIILKDKLDDRDIRKIVKLIDDENSIVSSKAIYALLEFRDRASIDDVRKIINLLGDDNCRVREEAINTMAAFRGSKLMTELNRNDICKIKKLARDKDVNVYVRKAAIRALDALKNRLYEKDIRELIGLINDKDVKVRSEAIYALERLKDRISPQDVHKVVELLGGKHWEVRNAAQSAVVAFKDMVEAEDVCKIAELLENENGEVRKIAMKALVAFHDRVDQKVVRAVTKQLRDEYHVREEAKDVLAAMKDRLDVWSIREIAHLLEDNGPDIRKTAAELLAMCVGRIDEEIVHQIANRLQDEDNSVQETAYNTLKLFYESGIPLP